MLDAEGRVVLWNPAAERMLGYTSDEAVRLTVADLYPADERQRGAPQSDLAAAAATTRFESTGWRIAKSGAARWASTVTCPIRDAAGSVTAYALVIHDHTTLRSAEQLVERQSHELKRSNTDLEAFATVAAHDLQEPLRKLRTFGDRLRRRVSTSADGDAVELVGRMNEAAGRMESLIDGLLSYARVSHRMQPRENVELRPIVAETLSDLSQAIEQSRARVTVGSLPSLRADPTQMRQLFQNLISNSIKFARPDVPLEIIITSSPDSPDTCSIRVEDNGIGFEQKYGERIFGLFQRLHGRSRYAGNGIGLAICRRIVEEHGGAITAEGLLGQGSAFKFRLPLNHRRGEPT